MNRQYLHSDLSAAAFAAALLLGSAIGTLPAQEPAVDAVDLSELDDPVEPDSPEVAAADQAARSWLTLVDEGNIEDAWASAANVFQVSISPQRLKAAIGDGRRGLDSLAARTLVGFRHVTNPSNAAPGEYVVLQYRLRGSPAWSALETVMPRREKGAWRVAGYAIKRE